jgi:hypothetical protein
MTRNFVLPFAGIKAISVPTKIHIVPLLEWYILQPNSIIYVFKFGFLSIYLEPRPSVLSPRGLDYNLNQTNPTLLVLSALVLYSIQYGNG